MPADAGGGAGRQAGDFGIAVGEAEVREDVGGVLMPVVVFDLDVVGFAVVFRDRLGGGAEAVRVEEVVAAAVRKGSGGEAFDSAQFDLFGSEAAGYRPVGYRWSEERKSCDEAEDEKHFVMRWIVIRNQLLGEKNDRRRDRLSKYIYNSKIALFVCSSCGPRATWSMNFFSISLVVPTKRCARIYMIEKE